MRASLSSLREMLHYCDDVLDVLESQLTEWEARAERQPIVCGDIAPQIREEIQTVNTVRDNVLWHIREAEHGKEETTDIGT
jgi:hypothetical protein